MIFMNFDIFTTDAGWFSDYTIQIYSIWDSTITTEKLLVQMNFISATTTLEFVINNSMDHSMAFQSSFEVFMIIYRKNVFFAENVVIRLLATSIDKGALFTFHSTDKQILGNFQNKVA